ncbi:MAG: (2Fe-2S)-binding protein, partial [Hyphomicrobiaceae bacterium]
MSIVTSDTKQMINLNLNGKTLSGAAEPRLLLSDFLRHELGATGTHVGCEHGICGACTIQLDGEAVRSCLMLAVQADGRRIDTVEGLAEGDGELGVLQQCFREHHALQCGFCTSGILMSLAAMLRKNPDPDAQEI